MEGRAQAPAGGRQPFSIYPDRRLAAMRGMRAPMIVEAHPVTDPLTGFAPAPEGMQVDALILQRAPQPFDEDVVEEPAPPVHRDSHPGLFQALRPSPRRKLAGLIGVEYLRCAKAAQRLIQRIDAEPDVHGVRQTPRQNLAAPAVHDRHQIQKALRKRYVGDVSAPHLIGSLNTDAPQQIRVNPVPLGGNAGP